MNKNYFVIRRKIYVEFNIPNACQEVKNGILEFSGYANFIDVDNNISKISFYNESPYDSTIVSAFEDGLQSLGYKEMVQ